ncbi:hypothetical protein T310_4496 [Rasamsonia emersonii CBS 393.64]|uniref:Uncharacterized protein n=1 Tax=Rasamsonia emersonii (strain ATCC 16479 / CBS 393.64 / IMI 116815) TaxID=1408163 RepID=A0A0F4YUC7_RASE3|nr:hypothetical protein T310_4496 [Rasamsonia emersonii CBS 393.64]KKA21461.1 hypothetical protein T310_4496 [Rasamsonia emersonii CBS 393.64]
MRSTQPRTENSPPNVPEDKLQYPSRQPRNAPRSTLAQADAGFAQFLKEHTSPKHHRVTAGGRIVPMNPDTPVPEFKPPAKKTKNDDPKKVAAPAASGKGRKRNTASGTSTHSFSEGSNINCTSAEVPPVTQTISGTAALFNGVDGSGSQQPPAPQHSTQHPVPTLASPFYQSQPLSFASTTYPFFQLNQAGQEYIPLPTNLTVPHQTSTDTLAWLPSMAQPFVAHRQIAQSPPPPFNPSLVGIGPPFPAAANRGGFITKGGTTDSPFTTSSPYPFAANPGSFAPYMAIPLASYPLPLSGYISDPATQRSLQDVTKEHENLTSQLANLDRYMAIHTFEMDPNTKKSLVEQRKGLVRDLDAARRYKEHLESSLKQPGTAVPDAEAASNLRVQPNFLQSYPGDAANNFGMAAAAWVPPMMANNTQLGWTPNPLGDFQMSSVPFGLEAFNNKAPLQFPTLGSLPSIPGSGAWGEYQPNVNISYGDQMEKQDCPATMDQVGDKQDMASCSNPQASQGTDARAQNDGWTSSTRSAPSEISRIYCKIEEAAKRGESFEGLLKELAKITEQFISQRHTRCCSSANGERLRLSSKPSKKDSVGVGPSQCSADEHKNEERDPSIEIIVTRADDATKTRSCRTGTGIRTCESVRCHMSDEEEDGCSCCSDVSAADSWATTEERDEPGIEENGKEKEAIVAKEIENTKNGNAVTNIDNTAEWIRRVNEMAPTRHKHSQSSRPNNLSELSINKEPSGEIRRTKSMVFTPWKSKEDQEVPAVKGCSPVISRVNAHGFLPSFDGAGDMPSSGGPNHSSFTFPGLRSSEGPQTMSRNPGQQSRPWYVKEPREKPNPVEIRRFFRQLAEEEREMIHKYRIQDHGEA